MLNETMNNEYKTMMMDNKIMIMIMNAMRNDDDDR